MRHPLLIASVFASLILVGVTVGQEPGSAPRFGPTLQGPIEGGGTIRITTTEDGGGVTGIAIIDATTGGDCATTRRSGETFYDPPRRTENGEFTAVVTAVRSPSTSWRFRVAGTVSGDGLIGEVNYTTLFCQLSPVAWEASQEVDTPPKDDDVVFVGDVSAPGREGDGTILLTLRPGLTQLSSVSLSDVPLGSCGDGATNVGAMFDPATDLDLMTFTLFTEGGALAVWLEGRASGDGELAGTLTFRNFLECEQSYSWSAAAAAEEPTPPSSASATGDGAPLETPVAFPSTGAASNSSGTVLVAALIALVGLIAALSGALLARR